MNDPLMVVLDATITDWPRKTAVPGEKSSNLQFYYHFTNKEKPRGYNQLIFP